VARQQLDGPGESLRRNQVSQKWRKLLFWWWSHYLAAFNWGYEERLKAVLVPSHTVLVPSHNVISERRRIENDKTRENSSET
jgi:hypothetical protein